MPAATPIAAPSVQVFSPARDTPPRPGPPPMHAGPRRPKPPRAAASSNLLDMDAYFAEGEAQSRALEGGSGGGSGSGIGSGSSRPGAAAPAPPPPATATTEHKEKAPLAPPPKAGSLPKFASVEWLGDSVTGVMSVNPSPGMVPMQRPERRRRTRRVGDDGTGEEEDEDEEEDTEEEHELLPEPRVVTPVVESARLPWEDDGEDEEKGGDVKEGHSQKGAGGGEKVEEKSQENAKKNA